MKCKKCGEEVAPERKDMHDIMVHGELNISEADAKKIYNDWFK